MRKGVNVFVCGINGGYGEDYIKVIPSTYLDLYDNCVIILNTITNNYRYSVYLGYRDYIDVQYKDIDLKKDTELSNLLIKDKPYPEIEFTRENVKYLNLYKRIYEFSLEENYHAIKGIVIDKGIFHYDDYALFEAGNVRFS